MHYKWPLQANRHCSTAIEQVTYFTALIVARALSGHMSIVNLAHGGQTHDCLQTPQILPASGTPSHICTVA